MSFLKRWSCRLSITSEEHVQLNSASSSQNVTKESRNICQRRKPSCFLSEIITSEQIYILNLHQIITIYLAELNNKKSTIEKPDDLKSVQARQVFGNIEDIYKWHKQFFIKILRTCVDNPKSFIKKMRENEKIMINLYVQYFRNKDISDYIVTKYERYFRKVQHKRKFAMSIQCCITLPVERIFKYVQWFEGITKDKNETNLEKKMDMQNALDIMKRINQAVNYYMVLSKLDNFPEIIEDQGRLIHHGLLRCLEVTRHFGLSTMMGKKLLQVFLLEQSIIFAKIIGDRNKIGGPSYEYKFHIKVSEMQLSGIEELGNNKFRINCYHQHHLACYYCEAENFEPEYIEIWVYKLKEVVQAHRNIVYKILNPVRV